MLEIISCGIMTLMTLFLPLQVFLINSNALFEALFGLSDVIDVETEGPVIKPMRGIVPVPGNSL